MPQHPGIQVQCQGFCNSVILTAFVTRLLPHTEDPIVSLDMIIGTIDVFPPQKDDHGRKLVCAQLLQGFGEKRVGLISWIVDHTRPTRASTRLGDALFKEAVKLSVALPKQLEFWGNGKHQYPVFLVLVTEFFLFTDDELLMLPDKRGLLFLAHALAALPLLLDFLAGTTRTLLAPLVPLTFETVLDGTHPV